jgi:hypothetical protein
MSIQGHVQNGVVVFDESVSLPEGTRVIVEPVPTAEIPGRGDWAAALQAARDLENYDFDAWRKQREADREDARTRLP